MARASEIGLCLDCRWARVVRSARGSRFYRCGLAGLRPSFVKYPRLPVRECEGHEPRSRADGGGSRKKPS